MDDRHLDGRARVALGCAVLSLLVVATPAAGIFFGFWGSLLAAASVIAVDEPAGPRTRHAALVAGLVAGTALAAGLILLVTTPQSGE